MSAATQPRPPVPLLGLCGWDLRHRVLLILPVLDPALGPGGTRLGVRCPEGPQVGPWGCRDGAGSCCTPFPTPKTHPWSPKLIPSPQISSPAGRGAASGRSTRARRGGSCRFLLNFFFPLDLRRCQELQVRTLSGKETQILVTSDFFFLFIAMSLCPEGHTLETAVAASHTKQLV